METLMNILREIDDSIDYEKEQALIDDRLEASEMIPENFNSAGAIYKMVCRLQEN